MGCSVFEVNTQTSLMDKTNGVLKSTLVVLKKYGLLSQDTSIFSDKYLHAHVILNSFFSQSGHCMDLFSK